MRLPRFCEWNVFLALESCNGVSVSKQTCTRTDGTICPEIRPHPLISTLKARLPLLAARCFERLLHVYAGPGSAFVLIKCANSGWQSRGERLGEIKPRADRQRIGIGDNLATRSRNLFQARGNKNAMRLPFTLHCLVA